MTTAITIIILLSIACAALSWRCYEQEMKIGELEAEIVRYRFTLAKVEKYDE